MSLILSGTDGLSDIDGSAATPAIRGTDANTGIFFPAADTVGVSTGGSERVRVDSSGNVGIGTASPTQTAANRTVLSVNGTTTAIVNLNAGGVNKSYFYFDGTNTNLNAISGNLTLQNDSANAITFNTNGASERMRIDSSGNLLVGDTAQVGAGQLCSTFNQATKYGLALKNSNATSTGVFAGFYNSSGTLQGYINQTNSTTVAYITSSDYRLKENIQPMTGALDKVAQLKPVTYKWKQEFGGTNSQGFIAHELQEVVPDCVAGEKDAVDANGNPQYQGIDTSFLVATLTAAIQEQQALIQSLTARITALETQNVDNPPQGETP
jgi:hypothetical protein